MQHTQMVDTLYSDTDLFIAKIKECDEVVPILIERTKTVACNDSTMPLIICGTIILLAIIATIIVWLQHRNEKAYRRNYLQNKVIQYIKKKGSAFQDNDKYVAKIESYIKDLD